MDKMRLTIYFFTFAEQLILYQRIVLIILGIYVCCDGEMEVAEHDVLGYVLRVRGWIAFKSTLVYWGEEKDSAWRPFAKKSASSGIGCGLLGLLAFGSIR